MGRGRTYRAALLVVAVAASSLTAASATAPATDACVLVQVPAVGQACPTGTGLWRVPVGNGGWVTTHGADPIPDGPLVPMTAAPKGKMPSSYYGWPLADPQCVSKPDREFHHQVLYTRPVDKPDRYRDVLNGIRIAVHASNGWLGTMAARFGRTLDYRVLCGGSSVSVTNVKLSITDANASFSTIVDDLIRQGFSSPFAKYWIFYDGEARFGAAGVGTFRLDDTPGADNQNNVGPGWAVTYNVGLFRAIKTMMHENGHNLGAVQFSAPNSNKAGHCLDGLDVMCYFERGGIGARYRADRCRIEDYDCRFDDYFNPRPPRGNYLATHWNTAAPTNRFLAGCVYGTGVLEGPGNAAAPVAGVLSADVKIPKACQGRPFSVSAAPQYPAAAMTAAFGAVPPDDFGLSWVGPMLSGPTLNLTRLPDADVCFYKGATLLRCHERHGPVELVQSRGSASSTSAESGAIPKGATTARIVIAAGAHAVWVFNAV